MQNMQNEPIRMQNIKKYNNSNANVAKYARRVNLRDNNVIISKIKGVYLVKKV